jgi:hypothetical protein
MADEMRTYMDPGPFLPGTRLGRWRDIDLLPTDLGEPISCFLSALQPRS